MKCEAHDEYKMANKRKMRHAHTYVYNGHTTELNTLWVAKRYEEIVAILHTLPQSHSHHSYKENDDREEKKKKKNKVSSNEQENGQKTNIKHKHSVIQKDLKAYEMKFN